ncbi:hypothetical protein HanPSC8_Chr15g0669991 [Helianthus annuus]|nr:hypothetical protein HanPSC8_Chr15g0669991 [Helianthus annuus]
MIFEIMVLVPKYISSMMAEQCIYVIIWVLPLAFILLGNLLTWFEYLVITI